MKRLMILCAGTLLLAGCGDTGTDEAATDAAASDDAPAEGLLPGAFLIRTEVVSIDSADDADPVTDLAVGDVSENEVCIGEDGLLPAAAFAESGDECTIQNPYVRRGRLRQDLTCNRPAGQVNLAVNATFTGESLEGEIDSGTSFAGEGDYRMQRRITGERTGDCTNAEADADLEAEVAE